MKKDFVVNRQIYHVNDKLKDIETVSGVCSDKININGELKITGFNRKENRLRIQGVYVKLPTDDKIFIPASYHPWVKSGQDSFPVFIEDKSELKWHKDLVAGDFYIMLNEFSEKRIILINCISDDKIEYAWCNSICDGNNNVYHINEILCELPIKAAKYYKFIPLKDITC